MKLFFATFLLAAQAVAPQPIAPRRPAPQNVSPSVPQNASPLAPKNATPPGPTVEPTPDPASSHFLTEAGLLIVAVKPAAIPDYDLVIQKLQEALSKDTDPIRVAAAKAWRVYKSDADAKGNQLYVHVMLPTVTGFDYRPSLLLDELVKDLAPDVLSRYQEAFAVPPTKLNLSEFANMAIAPLNVTPPGTAPVTPPVTAPLNGTPPGTAPVTPPVTPPPAVKKPPGRR